MLRRHLLQAALAVPRPTHIVTLSFDDGFKKSFYRIAAIHERYGLRACFNVIASGHLPGFKDGPAKGDPLTQFELGDFTDWNALKKRGHEVMAHTWDHARLTTVSLEDAKAKIDRCASYFERHLEGFVANESVYSFAYNASTPELEAYALSKFQAIRTRGDGPVNPIPPARKPLRIGCISRGPDNIDDFLESSINRFLAGAGGWFVFNTHGLDEEGWGPVSSTFLDGLLARLVKLRHVAVLPAGEVSRCAGCQ